MEQQLGEVGTRFLFENDRVKVWNLELEPGQASDWHRHERHYLFIVLEPSTLRAEFADGASVEDEAEEGEVVMGQKGSVHRVTNVGSTRYKNVIVEIKE